jgi:hypothetical protein
MNYNDLLLRGAAARGGEPENGEQRECEDRLHFGALSPPGARMSTLDMTQTCLTVVMGQRAR